MGTPQDIWAEVLSPDEESTGPTVLPPEEDHLHVPAGQNLSDPSHLGQVATHLLDLLLGGDRVQLVILVSIWNVKILSEAFLTDPIALHTVFLSLLSSDVGVTSPSRKEALSLM